MVGDGDDVGQSVRVRRGLHANVRIHNYQHVVRTSKPYTQNVGLFSAQPAPSVTTKDLSKDALTVKHCLLW